MRQGPHPKSKTTADAADGSAKPKLKAKKDPDHNAMNVDDDQTSPRLRTKTLAFCWCLFGNVSVRGPFLAQPC